MKLPPVPAAKSAGMAAKARTCGRNHSAAPQKALTNSADGQLQRHENPLCAGHSNITSANGSGAAPLPYFFETDAVPDN
jgi:hypothetical protein